MAGSVAMPTPVQAAPVVTGGLVNVTITDVEVATICDTSVNVPRGS